MVFTCSAANSLVYLNRGTLQAAGAGHIILSIVQVSISKLSYEYDLSLYFCSFRLSGFFTLGQLRTRYLTPTSILSLFIKTKNDHKALTHFPQLIMATGLTRALAAIMPPRCILALS